VFDNGSRQYVSELSLLLGFPTNGIRLWFIHVWVFSSSAVMRPPWTLWINLTWFRIMLRQIASTYRSCCMSKKTLGFLYGLIR